VAAVKPSALAEAAFSCIGRRWAVLPLRPNGKEPLTRQGVKDATTDEATVRRWWAQWPRANLGVATGGVSGLVVLDVDPRSGGDESLHDLEARHGPLPETVTALMGGGGAHYYFAAPPGMVIRSRQLAPGLDLKAEGGYVVAPPSVHPSGRPYEWEVAHSPDEVPLAPLPDWLLELAQDGRSPDRYDAFDGQPISEGHRHNHLVSLAGKLRADGLSPEAIEAALLEENARRCDPPLPEEEVRRIARSMIAYPPRPRDTRGDQSPADTLTAPTVPAIEGEEPIYSSSSQAPPSLDGGPRRPTLLVEVPPFPLHVLPQPFRQYVVEVAAGMDCPPDLVAVPLLAVAGATWGNRVALRLTGQWAERAIVWAAVVADPGSAKSPAMEAALHPLQVLQRTAYARWREELRQWEAKAVAARATKQQPPPRPALEHFYTTDVTLEALARILGEGEEDEGVTPGLAVTMDELAAWVRSFDAYHERGERQRWLSLWAGAPVKVDRASKGTTFIERPVVCVVGGITPDCLRLLEAEAQQEDGFIDRLLYAFPDTRPMRFVDAPAPQVALSPLLGRLRSCREGEVALSPEAKEIFGAYVDTNAKAQEREPFRPLRRYRAKLPRHLARLALVLHCLQHPDGPAAKGLAGETMRAAIELADYFLAHARRTLLEFGEGALARRVLGLLAESGGELGLTELYAALGRHVRASELRAVGAFLQAGGLIEAIAVPPDGPRGRPGERWRLAAPLHGERYPPLRT
jgi:hypothetical protein